MMKAIWNSFDGHIPPSPSGGIGIVYIKPLGEIGSKIFITQRFSVLNSLGLLTMKQTKPSHTQGLSGFQALAES